MAFLSLKEYAADCLGVTPSFSVLTDVFGYIFRDQNGTVFGGQTETLSLRRQIQLGTGRATNFSIFLVGHENDFSGVVTLAQVIEVQFAIQVARDLCSQVNLGVRKNLLAPDRDGQGRKLRHHHRQAGSNRLDG
jgi:hypothetical protein